MKRKMILVVLILGVLGVSGCGTIGGLGQLMRGIGEDIENAADGTRAKMAARE